VSGGESGGCPTATGFPSVKLNGAVPLELVVTLSSLMNLLPSPPLGLEKHSSVNVLFGVLFSLPVIVVRPGSPASSPTSATTR
jgi:hypothetical protein